MRFRIAAVLILFTAVAQPAEDTPKATWRIQGANYEVAKQSVKGSLKVVLECLESCAYGETADRNGQKYTKDDLEKALAGDHFQVVFEKARMVTVINKPLEVTELVIAAGSIWVRSGDKVHRFAKYGYKQWDAFLALRQDAAKGK